eukprot:2643951-Pleurochrysis_carterae.AAC.1
MEHFQLVEPHQRWFVEQGAPHVLEPHVQLCCDGTVLAPRCWWKSMRRLTKRSRLHIYFQQPQRADAPTSKPRRRGRKRQKPSPSPGSESCRPIDHRFSPRRDQDPEG